MTERTFTCRHCRNERTAAEVVVMVGVSSGIRSYLCKPETARSCWLHGARPRLVERVGVVDDDDRGDE